MPKVAETFRERAVAFAMNAPTVEVEDVLLIVKQILKSRLKAEQAPPVRKQKGKPNAVSQMNDRLPFEVNDDATS
jgi:hypothetical protein